MTTPQEFKNRTVAHGYLEGLGYEIPYSTFALACKNGECKIEAGGKRILLSSLTDYINTNLGSVHGDGNNDLARVEKQLDIDLKRDKLEKAEITTREKDKEWMLRADHEKQTAAVFGVAFDIVRREINLVVDDIIKIVGCDGDRKPELLAMLKDAVDNAGNLLANTAEFDVVFEGSEEVVE